MTRVIVINQYGEELCELKQREHGGYEMPEDVILDVGDMLKVEEVWMEE